MSQWDEKMKLGFLYFLTIFNTFAFTVSDANKAGLVYYHQYELNDKSVSIIVEVDKGELYLNLYNEKNAKGLSFSMAQTEKFNKTEITEINNYQGAVILSQWNKGVHGKQLFIHDIKSGKELLHIKSSFTLDYTINNDNIVINWTSDMQKENTPKKEQTIWPHNK